MITGYNTDVRRNDVVLHVQTEDKGVANPCIESLVYVGGQVLVAKRASYAEVLADGKGEKEIVAMMDRQHRTIIAAIRGGKFDQRLEAFLDKGNGTGHGQAATPEATEEASVTERTLAAMSDGPTTEPVTAVRAPVSRGPVSPPDSAPPEAARSEGGGAGRTLDQVILEYLSHEAEHEQLLLTLEEDRDIALGQRAYMLLRASSSKSSRPVAGTEVEVKMISTVAGPRILARGESSDDGMVKLSFDVPDVDRGTAALIISASSRIGRAELKQLL